MYTNNNDNTIITITTITIIRTSPANDSTGPANAIPPAPARESKDDYY